MTVKAEITYNEMTGTGIYRMKLGFEKAIKALPGQFLNVLVSETYSPLLRRPFSIFDCGGRTAEIVYKVIGKGTVELAKKASGETLDVIGPLGVPYPDLWKNRDTETVIVGGGTGAASTHSWPNTSKQKKPGLRSYRARVQGRKWWRRMTLKNLAVCL